MKISSMTGYGRAQCLLDGRDISVEIKSVNHRFFEFSARVPRTYGYLEEKLKAFVYRSVSRGKVDVNVTVLASEGVASEVQVNRELARSYHEQLQALGNELGLADDLSLSAIARFNDIFSVRKAEDDEQAVWAGVSAVAQQALEAFLAMRAAEGEALCADMLERLSAIEALVARVEELSPKTVQAYRERLYNKLCEVLEDRQIDQSRLITEAAIFSEKTAVAEETVRLRSHIAQFRQILAQAEPVGRKLDFLVQELNRETNTIGSKAQDVDISRIVVDIKSEIEKIREQIQNVE